MVRYMGLDISSVATGVSIIDRLPNGSLKLVAHDVISSSYKKEIGLRLVMFAETLQTFLDEYQPDFIIREETINNRASNAILYKFLGVVQFLARNNGYDKTYEYYPTTIKKTVVGHGRASKMAVAEECSKYFTEDFDGLTEDETDSIGAVLTHLIKDDTLRIVTVAEQQGYKEHEKAQEELVEGYLNGEQ